MKNVEIDAVDVTLPKSEVEGDKVGNRKPVDPQVDAKANGEEVDGSNLKSEPVASDVASDEADLDDDGLDLSKSTLKSIKEGGGVDLFMKNRRSL